MNSSGVGDVSNLDPKENLVKLWRAAQDSSIAAVNTTPQTLFEGVNLRFHLGHAMKAALETAKACASLGKVLHNPFELWAWVECTAEVGAAIMSMFESLVQRMSEIQYVTAVVLSEHIPSGIAPEQLKIKVSQYLNDPTSAGYSWHFGMSQERLAEAKRALDDEDWFILTLDKLRETGFIFDEPVSGKLMFRSVDFVVGMKSEIGE